MVHLGLTLHLEANVKWEWPIAYANRMALPYLQDALYKLYEQFTCQLDWQLKHYNPKIEEAFHLKAAPLPQGIFPPPPNEPVQVHIEVRTILGEYTCNIFGVGYEPRQGKPEGIVELKIAVGVELGFRNAYGKYMDSISRNGFLCEAEELVLQDDSRCYRVHTDAGLLWLRSISQPESRHLNLLQGEQMPIRTRNMQVIHLAETTYQEVEEDRNFTVPGPWTHLETHDESGRRWVVKTSWLHFGVVTNLVGRSNRWLLQKPSVVLEPPYEVVLQPEPQQDYGVSFILASDY
jgi:hypothetical protein